MYHILIVDEEEHLLWALERNLFPERDDVVVHTASCGEDGLETLEEESIDLLISDIKMPGDVDGFQLILRAKEMCPDARVMIITAFGTHRIKNFAERIGISHYIEKPFTVDELRGAVLEILDEKEGFQGVLSDLELTDIIQMLCLAKRTALLHLKHRDHRGRIVFDTGDVTHAEFDGEVGAEAVFAMLDLRQGDIFMQSDFEPEEHTIDMSWQDLLLEGVKRTDEQRLEAQREETRETLAAENSAAETEREDSGEDEDWDRDESGRTKTPMGMGAPTMTDEAFAGDDSDSSLGEESSSGMFFSEEELQEISRASEAAIDEHENTDEGAGADDGGQRAESPTESSEDSGFEQPDQRPLAKDDDGAEADELDGATQEGELDGDAGENGEANLEDREPRVGDEAERDQPVQSQAMGRDKSGDESGDESARVMREEAPTVEVSTDMFASTMGGIHAPSNSEVETGPDAEDSNPPFPQQYEGTHDIAAVEDQAADEETDGARDRSNGRQRSETSPGMASVSPDHTTDESGEFEMFAAPALSGRTTDSPTAAEQASTAVEEFVNECPGLKATAVMSIADEQVGDLVNLAYDEMLEQVELFAGLSDVLGRARRSIQTLKENDRVEELQLVLANEYLLLRPIEDSSLVHVAIVDRQVSLGIALVLMRQFGKRYAPDGN